ARPRALRRETGATCRGARARDARSRLRARDRRPKASRSLLGVAARRRSRKSFAFHAPDCEVHRGPPRDNVDHRLVDGTGTAGSRRARAPRGDGDEIRYITKEPHMFKKTTEAPPAMMFQA